MGFVLYIFEAATKQRREGGCSVYVLFCVVWQNAKQVAYIPCACFHGSALLCDNSRKAFEEGVSKHNTLQGTFFRKMVTASNAPVPLDVHYNGLAYSETPCSLSEYLLTDEGKTAYHLAVRVNLQSGKVVVVGKKQKVRRRIRQEVEEEEEEE
ncbi:hypothetical protein Tco_0914808 [Tanacetum coccineum]